MSPKYINRDLFMKNVMMPDIDGLEAAQHIRKLNRKDATLVPIIAMTANAFAEDVHKTFESGMNYHLSKLFSQKDIEEILTKLFRK